MELDIPGKKSSYSRPSIFRIAIIRTLANPNRTECACAIKIFVLHVISWACFSQKNTYRRVKLTLKLGSGISMAAPPSSKLPKRPHKSVTIETKLEILGKIGKKSYKLLLEEYEIGRSTIADIKRRRMKLEGTKERPLNWEFNDRPRKNMKMGQDEELESALFIWFRQKREEGIPLTGLYIYFIVYM